LPTTDQSIFEVSVSWDIEDLQSVRIW